MKRLVFIKYLYTQGLTQSKQSPPLSSASVLSFHDAVELFLHLTLEHVGASKKDPSFMEYWDLINDKLDTYIATLEKICNGFWIPENIRFTVNVDARIFAKSIELDPLFHPHYRNVHA